jgi:copper chaperone CopZ
MYYWRFEFLWIVLLCWPAGIAAQEPLEYRHRVTGLFSEDRVADLRVLLEKFPGITLKHVDFNTAEAVFEYDADQLFNKPNPDQLIERFDMLLRNESRGTFGIRPLCLLPKEKLQRVEIPVLGLDCKGCSLGAYEAIFKLDGVEQATASFKLGLVTAWIDPARTNRAVLEDALKKKNVTLKTE